MNCLIIHFLVLISIIHIQNQGISLINFDSFGKFFNLLNLTLEPIDAKESIFQAYRDFFRTTTTQKTKQPLATNIVPSSAQTKPTKMLTTPSKLTTSTKVLTTPTKPTTLTKKTTLYSPTSTKVTTSTKVEKGALLQLGAKNSTKKGYTSKLTRRPTTIFQVPCDCAPCDCAPCDCVPCDCLFWQNYPPMPIRTYTDSKKTKPSSKSSQSTSANINEYPSTEFYDESLEKATKKVKSRNKTPVNPLTRHNKYTSTTITTPTTSTLITSKISTAVTAFNWPDTAQGLIVPSTPNPTSKGVFIQNSKFSSVDMGLFLSFIITFSVLIFLLIIIILKPFILKALKKKKQNSFEMMPFPSTHSNTSKIYRPVTQIEKRFQISKFAKTKGCVEEAEERIDNKNDC
jgi:hypothetical protein